MQRGIDFNVKEYRTFYTGSVGCISEFPFISCILSVTEEDLVRRAFVILQAHRYEDVVFVTQSATSHATSTVQEENIFVPKALVHITCIHCSSYLSISCNIKVATPVLEPSLYTGSSSYNSTYRSPMLHKGLCSASSTCIQERQWCHRIDHHRLAQSTRLHLYI